MTPDIEKLIADLHAGDKYAKPHECRHDRCNCALMSEAADALASLVREREWQTMDTAPKGKAVLVALDLTYQEPDCWIIGEARLRSEGDADDGWWWANESPGDHYAEKIVPEPSYWQPLPPQPTRSRSSDARSLSSEERQ